MKNIIRKFAVLTLLFTLVLCAHAQNVDTLRMMSYNILNWPGSDGATRVVQLRKVIRFTMPDVIVAGEITSTTGMTLLRDQALNVFGTTDWAYAPFIDGPDTDAGLFYRTSKVTFIEQITLTTELRNIYVYRVRPVGHDSTNDLYLYMMHLKSSNTSADEAQRGRESAIARSHANSLPAGTKFVYMGDMNLYTSTEVAYSNFTASQSDNDGRSFDPLPAGNWHDNAQFSQIHTQSPRTRAFGGGSTGGMDDRFDFILPSLSLDQLTGTRYQVGSCFAVGNDGNHLNDSINRRPNTAAPDSVIDALHNGSDHLPVMASFLFARPGSITLTSPNGGEVFQIATVDTIRWSSTGVTGNLRIELNRNYPSGSWETLFASISNTGFHTWQVTAPASTNARLRISSLTGGYTSTSTSAFSIQAIPELHTSLSSLSFATRRPHTSDSITFAIANQSHISFRYATRNAPSSNAFRWVVLDTDSLTNANDSLKLRVYFTPDSILQYRDTLRLTFESPYNPIVIPIDGSGIGGYLAVSTNRIDFTNLQIIHTSDSIAFSLSVSGSSDVSGTLLPSTNAAFSTSIEGDFILSPATSTPLWVRFHPTLGGQYTTQIRIISNAVNVDTLIIDVSGVATEIPAAPTGLTIQRITNDAQLRWNRVSTSTIGNPIIVDGYVIRYRTITDTSWQTFDYTLSASDTTYTHQGAFSGATGFYQISTFVGTPDE